VAPKTKTTAAGGGFKGSKEKRWPVGPGRIEKTAAQSGVNGLSLSVSAGGY